MHKVVESLIRVDASAAHVTNELTALSSRS